MKCRSPNLAAILLLLALTLSPAPLKAANWYMDNAATGANTGANWANAWKNYSQIAWSKISAGDTLFISGGSTFKTYTETNLIGGISCMFAVGKNGTEGNPIRITVGQDPGHTGRVIFDAQNRVSYIFVCGGNYSVVDGGPNTNLWLINCTAQSDRNTAAGYFGGSGSHQTVSRIVCSNLNNGILYNGGTDHDIGSNTLKWIIGDVGISDGGGTMSWDSVKVHHNYVQCIMDVNLLAGADGIKCMNGASVYNNTMVCTLGNGFTNSGQHSDAFQTSGQINFSKYYNNRVHGFYNAVFEFGVERDTHDVWIYNNVITYDSLTPIGASHAIAECSSEGWLANSISNVFWINNTFVDFYSSGWGWEWDKNRDNKGQPIYHPTVTNFFMVNNVLYNCGDAWVLAWGTYMNTNCNGLNDIKLAYNLISAGSKGTTRNRYGGRSAGSYDLPNVNGVVNAPLFTSYTLTNPANVLSLTTNSPGVGMGTNLTALMAAFGIIAEDFEGNLRPATGPWTIGAYEAAQVGTTSSLALTPDIQDFGSVRVGTNADRTFTVMNVGAETISGSTSVPPPFSIVSGRSYSLARGQRQTVTVRYSPIHSPTVSVTNIQNMTFTGGNGGSATVRGVALSAAFQNLKFDTKR